MTQKELNYILKLHQMWLDNEIGGKRANLSEVDLSGANLINADLSKANLSGADLSEADLSGADLSYIITDENTKYFNLRCPVEGSFVGYKKCMYDVIVTLKITEDALRSSATGDKCRCSKAEVINIEGAEEAISWYSGFIYHKGDIVEVKDFNQNRWIECTSGIHFFMTKEEAIAFIF